ncbi:MAG: M48 family metalloprotease [Desulfobulbaceae bacterium]|nr:M48 family metalloprotease [Desulfobulbaceae bacterium]
MFNNFLYLTVVIVALGGKDIPPAPALSLGATAVFFLLKGILFWQALRVYLSVRSIRDSAGYFRAETALSILAVVVFLADVYILDLHYYQGQLPLVAVVPGLLSLAGLILFYAYQALVWLTLRKSYERVLALSRPPRVFVWEQLRNSAIVVAPWLLLTFLYDLLALVPNVAVQDFLNSGWGELAVLLVFFATLMFWFPPLMVKMMGCLPLSRGENRERIEVFCRRQGIAFGEICSWPLFGGRVLSAGVVGMVGKYRYLLLTPALLETASPDELEAVLAHEIGHVKKHHLILYLLLLMGLGVLIQLGVQPLLYGLLGSPLLLGIFLEFAGDPQSLLSVLTGVPLVILAILYVRFVFGYFMRNFERQADLYAYRASGGAGPLSAILEKIAWLGGNIRERPCWHHFGIGQRIDYLRECAEGKRKPLWQEVKVYASLALFALFLCGAVLATWQLGNYLNVIERPGAELAKSFVDRKLQSEPDNPLWLHLRADLLAAEKRYPEAVAAYEKSLLLQPENSEVLNNLAWLYLTAERKAWQDAVRGLELASKAAALSSRSHVLDTLAEAQWQNGEASQAIATERRALAGAQENREYYRGQLQKFQDSLGS